MVINHTKRLFMQRSRHSASECLQLMKESDPDGSTGEMDQQGQLQFIDSQNHTQGKLYVHVGLTYFHH